MAIPKILHYCWFGGSEMPKSEQKYVKKFSEIFKDYQIKLWNENNFDIHCNKYVEQAYDAKKYMYVSDYARLKALYDEGGIYLDTDCLVLKDFADLLDGGACTGYGGDNREIAAHALIFPAGHKFIKECLDSYENDSFINEDGSYKLYTINARMTDMLIEYGFNPNGEQQTVCDITIYPMTYFCPISMLPDTVRDCKSKQTYCIHVWSSKELKRERRWYIRLARKLKLNKIKQRIFNR